MNIPFELHVALRYLLAKRKQASVSISSYISVIGVTVGVAAVIIALSLMTGLQTELRDRVLGSGPHIYVWKTGGLGEDYRARAPEAAQCAARRRGRARNSRAGPVSLGDENAFVQIKGMDPALEQEVTDVKGALLKGSLDALRASDAEDHDGILLGKDLAADLHAEVGDIVRVMTTAMTVTPFAAFHASARCVSPGPSASASTSSTRHSVSCRSSWRSASSTSLSRR